MIAEGQRMHDAITVGVPVLAILFGILWNQRGLERLDGRMDRLEARLEKVQFELNARLDRMQADLSMFYKILGEHGARLDNLEKNRNS